MTQPPGRDRSLTRTQFDEVIRRASELAIEQGESADGTNVSEEELYRIAADVGLPEAHVRRALSEVRTTRVPEPEGWVDRFFGPDTVRAGRVVAGTPHQLTASLDEYMVGGRLLQRVRRTPDFMQYRPAVDWMSQVARAASGTARRYYIASAKEVEIHLHAVDDSRTHVEFRVDPGIRAGYVGGGIGGGLAAGAATGFGATLALAIGAGAPEPLALGVGLGSLGLISSLIATATARAHLRKYEEVRAELEGVLDQLESGDRLNPPPASWRKWIERRFHGARRLIEPGTQDDD